MDEKLEESKAIAVNTSFSSSKEYTDEKGQKIVVSDIELQPENLSKTDIRRVEMIANISEFKTKELCLNCRFWNATENRMNKEGKAFPTNGECRVEAPVIRSFSSIEGVFPLISPYQWCGKYERKA